MLRAEGGARPIYIWPVTTSKDSVAKSSQMSQKDNGVRKETDIILCQIHANT
jgi:hypothetical protein